MEKLKGVKEKIKVWIRESFGDKNLAKSEILGKIERLDSKEEDSFLEKDESEERRILRNRLEDIIFKEMVAGKQKNEV